MSELLCVNHLSIAVKTDQGSQPLVKDISFVVNPLETVALVGGSGAGKTTIGLSLLRLLPSAMNITAGEILFLGRDLLTYSDREMQKIRGQDISMIFQEPLSAFNPVFKVGSQIAEVLYVHTSLRKKEIQEKVQELLRLVEIPDPQRVAQRYPHQLSGGLRQRAMIAMALAASPKLVVADEPTSNLDVTVQARILDLFQKLKEKLRISMVLITHDLGVVKYLADRILVLEEGAVIEQGDTLEVFRCPKQLFTQKLIKGMND